MDPALLTPVPVHVSSALLPSDRGEEFGAAMRAPLGRSLDAYAQLFTSIGLGRDELSDAAAAYRGWMHHQTPDLLLELDGMAGGAGVDSAGLLTLNARTELLAVATRRMPWAAAASECSTLAGETPEGPWLVQNWDWYIDHAAARVVWIALLDGERWFATFTEVGVLAKIGLNDRGVAVGLNLLRSTVDGKRTVGMPIHLALRLLLEDAATWADGAALLSSAAWVASSCITVAATSEGVARAVEVSPNGIGVVAPAADGVLRHTNHFMTDVARDLPPDPAAVSTTEERLACLVASPPQAGGSSEWAARMLSTHDDAGPVCRHLPGDYGATLAQVGLQPGAPAMWFAAGPPCTAQLAHVPLPVSVS